jgi:DNA recombination protein RmuC
VEPGYLFLAALLGTAVGAGLALGLAPRATRRAFRIAEAQRLASLEGRLGSLGEGLDRRLAALEASLDRRLAEDARRLDERLRESGRALSSVGEALVRVEAANRRLTEVGQDISSLNDLLRAPKARGGLGELLLEELLADVLPGPCYALQHTFSSGARADAVLRVGGQLVAVDAKFPLENARRIGEATDAAQESAARSALARDMRRHADAISTKYICPEDGTADFALMYIPAESVYHQALLDQPRGGDQTDLYAYCLRRRVVPVSPNTFYAYLTALLMALRGAQVEETAREVLASVALLRAGLSRFEDEYQTLGGHLQNAAGAYARGERRLQRWNLAFEKLESLPVEEVESG